MTATVPGRARGVLALALLLALVLGLLATGYPLYRRSNLTDEPYNPAGSGRVLVADKERHAAVAVAEQFCLRMDNVDGSDPEGYVERVSEVLTTKLKAKFTQEFEAFDEIGVEPGLKGKGTVLASALTEIDPDSATALVAHDSDVTTEQGTTQRHYRWEVDLRKVDGRWLVDDFTPVS